MRRFAVLEIGDDPAVSFAGRVLASYGFRVICAEGPGGHAMRHLDGVWPAFGAAKESIVVDPMRPSQLRWLGAVALNCDVVLDGVAASGGRLGRLVRSYLKRRMAQAPGGRALVSVTPFGLAGTKAGWRANPFVTYHAGGDAYFLPPGPGSERRAPVAVGDLAGECMAGWTIAGIALAFGLAARAAGESGHFSHIDVSKQEALLDLNRVELSRFANQGALESRMTKAYETGGLLHTRDLPIVIMPLENHQWQKLFEVMGNPAWTRDEAFATRAGRSLHAPDLQHRLQEWCLGYTAEELYHMCQRAGVPAGVVRGPAQVFSWKQSRQRGFFQPVADEDGSKVEIPWLPMATSLDREVRTPSIGEHSAAVLVDELHLCDRRELSASSVGG